MIAELRALGHEPTDPSPVATSRQAFIKDPSGHYSSGRLTTKSKFTTRYGQFGLQGYLTYTGRFSNQLEANTVLWGGVGLVFKY